MLLGYNQTEKVFSAPPYKLRYSAVFNAYLAGLPLVSVHLCAGVPSHDCSDFTGGNRACVHRLICWSGSGQELRAGQHHSAGVDGAAAVRGVSAALRFRLPAAQLLAVAARAALQDLLAAEPHRHPLQGEKRASLEAGAQRVRVRRVWHS